MPARIDVIGQRFERVTVLANAAPLANGRRRVQCACSCGATFICEPRDLRRGATRSCGCLQKERVAAASRARTTHGAVHTREYNIWLKMKARCLNPSDAKYPIYGGRGVAIHPEWVSDFTAFLRDVGPSPSRQHSIDRIDVNGDYRPGNCRWSTAKEQSRNKRSHRLVSVDGRLMPLSQACELTGINYRSALYRLNRGHDWLPPSPPESTDGR